MFLPASRRNRLAFLAAVLMVTGSTGCSMTSECDNQKSCQSCQREYLGVQDPLCHGHRQTYWRRWNEAACGPDFCPDMNALAGLLGPSDPGQPMPIPIGTETEVPPAEDSVAVPPLEILPSAE
ncbi:MAG: hypothetical protein RIK87_13620 [Fuerstiella sp.]